MGFIRIKIIKGKRYAYAVENTWKKRKGASRQKVGKYLGKVVSLKRKSDPEFKWPPETSKNALLLSLVEHELLSHGFEKKDGVLFQGDLLFSLAALRFVNSAGKEINLVLEMNEGFLCKYTLSRVLNFKAGKEDERENAISLAKAFLESGLKVPHEVFVGYYEKI